jgi:hypothetical protein
MQIQRYQGSPDRPVPLSPDEWQGVESHDPHARARAASLLGELPPYHFVDERGPSGLYRFFAYETPFGMSVSALRRELEGEPDTLGATNPNFKVPSAAQVNANPPGAALADAAVALLTEFSANGVPSEHAFSQAVDLFQTAWNADPLSEVNGSDSALDEDGGYGPNAHDALASISGGTAPPVNTSPAPPGTTPPGRTTNEPVPQPDASCAGWVVDASTPQVTAIASTIAFHDSPTAWVDQGVYSTTVNGTAYRFVMFWQNGLKAVAAYKCTSGGGGATPSSTASSSSTGPIIAGVLIVGALVATGFAARKPLAHLYRRHA